MKYRLPRLAMCLLGLAWLSPANRAAAQGARPSQVRAVKVRDAPASRRGVITLRAETQLSAGGEEFGGVSRSMILRRDSRGRYYHVNIFARHKVLVFNSAGRYLTAFGREGKGPGEFSLIGGLFVGNGDTLHIFDQGRYLVYSSSLQHVRTIGTGTGLTLGFADLTPNLRFVSSPQGSRAGASLPLHQLSAATVVRAFGLTEAPRRERPEPGSLDRVLARASDSSFWAAHTGRYILELWRADGSLLRRLEREAPWFDIKPRASLEGRFNPNIVCILRDTAQRLWIVTKVRDPRVRDLFEFVGPEIGPYRIRNMRPKSGRPQDIFTGRHTVIEVIDAARAEAIASIRLNWEAYGCPDQSSVFGYEEAEDGTGRLIVWRLGLAPKAAAKRD